MLISTILRGRDYRDCFIDGKLNEAIAERIGRSNIYDIHRSLPFVECRHNESHWENTISVRFGVK